MDQLVAERVRAELGGEPVREDHALGDRVVVGGRLLGEEVRRVVGGIGPDRAPDPLIHDVVAVVDGGTRRVQLREPPIPPLWHAR